MFKVNNKNTGATSQPTSGNFRFVRFITTQATGTKEVHLMAPLAIGLRL